MRRTSRPKSTFSRPMSAAIAAELKLAIPTTSKLVAQADWGMRQPNPESHRVISESSFAGGHDIAAARNGSREVPDCSQAHQPIGSFLSLCHSVRHDLFGHLNQLVQQLVGRIDLQPIRAEPGFVAAELMLSRRGKVAEVAV